MKNDAAALESYEDAHSWYHYKDYEMIHLCVPAIRQSVTRARKYTPPLTSNLIPEDLLPASHLKE